LVRVAAFCQKTVLASDRFDGSGTLTPPSAELPADFARQFAPWIVAIVGNCRAFGAGDSVNGMPRSNLGTVRRP
jgi:hypothetical protein